MTRTGINNVEYQWKQMQWFVNSTNYRWTCESHTIGHFVVLFWHMCNNVLHSRTGLNELLPHSVHTPCHQI